MKLTIKDVRQASSTEWDSIWGGCGYATFFHSREWALVWQQYSKQAIQPHPLLVEFSDGREAMVPLAVQKSGGGMVSNFISSPAGTYGGWLSTAELTMEHATLLAGHLQRMSGRLTWRLNPFDPLLSGIELQCSQTDETKAINLLDGFDAVHKRWTKGHRSAAQKARKAGVAIREAAKRDEWDEYFKVYEDSLQRWGDSATSRYSSELFHALHDLNSGNVRLWLACHEDSVIAGALCLYAKNHVVYWHGAALSQHFNLRPVNLLMYESIRDACERGYQWFDFNPSGGHEGAKAFKKSFGTESLPSNIISTAPRSLLLLSRLKRAAGTALAFFRKPPSPSRR
jgi:CelD/BcsL family acetyltransferase involved in cellulose biosynthesis